MRFEISHPPTNEIVACHKGRRKHTLHLFETRSIINHILARVGGINKNRECILRL